MGKISIEDSVKIKQEPITQIKNQAIKEIARSVRKTYVIIQV